MYHYRLIIGFAPINSKFLSFCEREHTHTFTHMHVFVCARWCLWLPLFSHCMVKNEIILSCVALDKCAWVCVCVFCYVFFYVWRTQFILLLYAHERRLCSHTHTVLHTDLLSLYAIAILPWLSAFFYFIHYFLLRFDGWCVRLLLFFHLIFNYTTVNCSDETNKSVIWFCAVHNFVQWSSQLQGLNNIAKKKKKLKNRNIYYIKKIELYEKQWIVSHIHRCCYFCCCFRLQNTWKLSPPHYNRFVQNSMWISTGISISLWTSESKTVKRRRSHCPFNWTDWNWVKKKKWNRRLSSEIKIMPSQMCKR